MAKASIQFVCEQCGGVSPRWMGKCPHCGAWDSLQEFRVAPASQREQTLASAGGQGVEPPRAQRLHEIDPQQSHGPRLSTGINEFDRVLGGQLPQEIPADAAPKRANRKATDSPDHGTDTLGLVPGSAVLVGGDPGIGKSTLMLQAADALARRGKRVLYVTSEESAQQLRLRAQRLTDANQVNDELFILADTNLARILEQARQVNPAVLVIDSIQMIYKSDLAAASGSVTQLRSCCLELVYFAKASGMALLLVGHVTKDGQLAGPRLLEHMVDTVLYFEGDRYHSYRIVRAIKNRFGTTLEVGLFEMSDRGLCQVNQGAGLLDAEYQIRSGSVVCPVLQGSRCLLVELQALTATGILGAAKRKVSGLDGSRLAMLIAVLEKRGGLRLADQDIFASSVGGMKIAEPAADLALALAIAGAHHNRSLPPRTCAVGEIGLGGEIRHVQHLNQRLHEATRLGFGNVIIPATGGKAGNRPAPPMKNAANNGMQLIRVATLDEALQQLG